MRKSHVLQELANYFPPWSRVRWDEQSVGQQLLAPISDRMEDTDKYIETHRRNNFLVTANLDEIDHVYTVSLPKTFEFTIDSSDPTNPVAVVPSVFGMVGNDLFSGEVTVTIAENNDLQSFWYTSSPNRATIETTLTAPEAILVNQPSDDFPFSGELTHPLGGGKLWIETQSGVQYISQDDVGLLERAHINLHGITRKLTEETETLIFGWDRKQSTQKDWLRLTKIEAKQFEDGVNITVRSDDFNNPPYQSFWNNRYSVNRQKVDEFWELGDTTFSGNTFSTLCHVGFITDDVSQLIDGFSDQETKQEWDLLDSGFNPVEYVDLKIQPFTSRAWCVTQSGILSCYELDETMMSGFDRISDSTSSADIGIDFNSYHFILGETVEFTPLHLRPLKEITRWRVWYETPSGSRYGLLAGSPVSYSSDFWSYTPTIARTIGSDLSLVLEERGEYLIGMDVEFVDEEMQYFRRLVSVDFKLPLSQLNIADWVGEDIIGLDFDADQRLWIKGVSGDYHKVKFHTDVMLIDYTNKVMYFKENYSQVRVVT